MVPTIRPAGQYGDASVGGYAPDGRKVKATLHWVSAQHAGKAEVRLYDRLFSVENPMNTEEGEDYLSYLNPNSLEVIEAYIEPGLLGAKPGDKFQFERQGYFCVDPDSTAGRLVFNRTVTLRDQWQNVKQKAGLSRGG